MSTSDGPGHQGAIVIAISGCSSSGKTTLAKILKGIFPNTLILHEDDFYKPEEQLPVKDGLVDWDSPDSISLSRMEKTLAQIRLTGDLPKDLGSYQEGNTVGECPVSDAEIANVKARVRAWLQPGQPGDVIFGQKRLKVCLLDGFLLYCKEMETVMKHIDLKLFLLVSHARAKERREARDGYVTLEGFWKDPPGYVDKIVWPNYVAAHGWLFEDGNVEGRLKEDVLRDAGIHAQIGQGLDVDFGITLEWAVETVMAGLERFTRREK